MSESGVTLTPTCTIADAPPLDTLIVPGGMGLREPATTAKVTKWITDVAPRIRRIASVCTGIYGLAPSGLLDGRRVTTHWRFAADVAARFPKLDLAPNELYVKSDRFYTAAGVTSGIDLALALIEEDLGSAAALAVARELVVYVKRDGGQAQFSEPLRFQSAAKSRMGELAAHITANLQARSHGRRARREARGVAAPVQPAVPRQLRLLAGRARQAAAPRRGPPPAALARRACRGGRELRRIRQRGRVPARVRARVRDQPVDLSLAFLRVRRAPTG